MIKFLFSAIKSFTPAFGFKMPGVQISPLGPMSKGTALAVPLFVLWLEIRTIKCNSPVDCCWMPARWHRHITFLPFKNGNESPHSDQKSTMVLIQNHCAFSILVDIYTAIWYNLFDKLELGGESPLTKRYGLRRSNENVSRPVASIRSAHGILQTWIWQ